MRMYESIVSESLLQEFPVQGPSTLMNYAANMVGLPATLAVASLLWPRLYEDHDMVFLAEQYYEPTKEIERTAEERQKLERIINAVPLGQFFSSEEAAVLENEQLLDALSEVLRHFWSLRLRTTFPERCFVVEIGENIAGEEGIAITFYQVSTPSMEIVP